MVLFLIGCLVALMLGLRWYTHHGQALELPNYRDVSVERAIVDARKKSFQIVVTDSVFMVGKEGGIVLEQNPRPGSMVKSRRKVYITVSKHTADQIPLRRLPTLYGMNYERKQRELKQGFEINTRIVGRAYDPGAPDHILEVLYKGETIVSSSVRKDDVLIDRGSTLEVVLSKSTGAAISMPDLVCKSYTEALFMLRALNLVLGDEVADADVSQLSNSYVRSQDPPVDSHLYTGDTVNIYLSAVPGLHCREE